MKRLDDTVVNELGSDTSIQIESFKKVEERVCYDALWEFKTSIGQFRVKTYDGISERKMGNDCKSIKTIKDLNDMQPKCFYYD